MNKKIKKHQDYRQGDVMLRRVDDINLITAQKISRDKKGRLVLLDGEVTGHAHAISDESASLFELDNERFLKIEEDVTLDHEDHDTHLLLPGTYQQIIQVEEGEDDEIRRVAD